jgi:hypothetical protein
MSIADTSVCPKQSVLGAVYSLVDDSAEAPKSNVNVKPPAALGAVEDAFLQVIYHNSKCKTSPGSVFQCG